MLLMLSGCQTPRFIEGRKVIGTQWVDGHVVYILAPNAEDRAATQKALKESEEAARNVTFAPSGK